MNLSDTDYNTLRELQRQSSHKRNYVKITVLLMVHLGEAPEKISAYLGVSVSTISRYVSAYETDGLSAYLANHYQGYDGKLTPTELAQLDAELTTHFYTSSAEVCAFVSTTFGKTYTRNGIVPVLHRLKYSYKKTKSVPCDANPAKQAEFVAQFEALMTNLPVADQVYFADAVHPQHNTRPTYGWIKQGTEIVY